MASSTKVRRIRERMKKSKMGRKRKAKLNNQGTTPARAVFFGDDKPPVAAAKASAE